MKVSFDAYGTKDFLYKYCDKNKIGFGFIHNHDKEKTEKGKKQINAIMLDKQKALMLRDYINSWLEQIKELEKDGTKNKSAEGN